MKIAIITTERGYPIFAVKGATINAVIKRFLLRFPDFTEREFKKLYSISFIDLI